MSMSEDFGLMSWDELTDEEIEYAQANFEAAFEEYECAAASAEKEEIEE